ncbi:MAG: PAS domain S-box protein, partial [Candidatus Tectomicrobia bacterium]|nr:PAS domain S-box protein [Candidatus Tectomicrobia bacterium]
MGLNEEVKKHQAFEILQEITSTTNPLPPEATISLLLAKILEERQIREMANEVIVTVDAEGRFTSVNRKFETITGHSRDEVLGKTPEEIGLWRSPHLEKAAQGSQRRMQGIIDPPYEIEVIGKDGQLIAAEVSSAPIYNDKGQVTGIVTIGRDIREQKRREQYEAFLIEASQLFNSSLNLNTVLQRVCEMATQVLGTFCTISLVDPEKHLLIPAARYSLDPEKEPLWRKVLEEDPIFIDETSIAGWVALTGQLYLAADAKSDPKSRRSHVEALDLHSILAVPILFKGKTIGVLSSAFTSGYRSFDEQDLKLAIALADRAAIAIENARLYRQLEETYTQLVESEAKYRSVVENAQDGIVILQGQRFLYFNQATVNMFGYTVEELGEINFFELVPPQFRTMAQERYERLYNGEGKSRFEIKAMRKDGTFLDVEGVSSLLIYNGQRVVLAIFRDITEQNRLKRQASEAEKFRDLGEMASGVAHDFNNLLTGILGNAQILQLMIEDESVRQRLNVIEKAALDGAEAVKRIQNFAKLRQTAHDFQSVDVNEIARGAVEMSRPRWQDESQKKGISIDIIEELGQIDSVMGNPSELREVLINMIFNAVDALPLGGRMTI